MNSDKLRELHIDRAPADLSRRTFRVILLAVTVLAAAAAWFAFDGRGSDSRIVDKSGPGKPEKTTATAPKPAALADAVLTVSGYVINRARIEISPHFQGTVKWIGVKKGDRVAKDQVVVTLDDSEQAARLHEASGLVAAAEARLEKAQLDFTRAKKLRLTQVEAQKIEDDARIEVASSQAALQQARGLYEYAKTQLDWTVIRSPIDGVVLEKLVEPDELVTPVSFGGTRSPSTNLIAVADPDDLQVEIDVNESDLPKIRPAQKCRVSPEAYPDRFYDGQVAEIAPEANRQKGTLQIKVQILKPDRFLTPELSARVDFLR